MKHVLYMLVFFASPTLLAAASESSVVPASSIPALSCSSEPTPHTTVKSSVLPRFDSQDNHLAYAHRILITIERHDRVDEQTKKVFNTMDNAVLWFANQNDQTKIKPGQKTITLAFENEHIKVKFLQHCWFGYRQVLEARKQHGLEETERYLPFMQHLSTVAKEAFKVCANASPDFSEPTAAEALSRLQAYSSTHAMAKKRARQSPTKKDRKTTQQITAFFKPLKMPRAE